MRWTGHVALWGRGELQTGFWWGNLREIDHLKDRGIDGEDNIKMDIQEVGWEGGYGLDCSG